MLAEPEITIDEIAAKVGRDRNAVNYQLKKMKADRLIERTGSDKTGHWKILIKRVND